MAARSQRRAEREGMVWNFLKEPCSFSEGVSSMLQNHTCLKGGFLQHSSAARGKRKMRRERDWSLGCNYASISSELARKEV